MKPTNIKDAMQQQRDCDMVTAILNNKFCLARCKYENGSYENALTIFGLDNGTVYSYGHASNIKNIINFTENMPIGSYWMAYNEQERRHYPKYSKNSRYKRMYRKAARAVKEYEKVMGISF